MGKISVTHTEARTKLKLLTPVTYNGTNHVVVDISGDMIKLSGIDEYIKTSALTHKDIIGPNSIESFEDMIALKPKVYELNDDIRVIS